LPWAEAKDVQRGQQVVAIGSPGVGNETLQNALSVGTLSSEHNLEGKMHYQLDLRINPGNSGGPILNEFGKVVGVVSCNATEKEGIAFCVPVGALEAEFNLAIKQSAAEIAAGALRHQQKVVFGRYTVATANYLDAGEILALLVAEPNHPENSKLRDVLQTKLLLGNAFADGMQSDLPRLMSSSGVTPPIKDRLAKLVEIYRESRQAAEHPDGTVGQYLEANKRLRREFNLLGSSLMDLLGV
jgi:hypothetical protein